MGIAIIVPDISFADANLGNVTLAEDIAIESLTINGEAAVNNENNKGQFSVLYNPSSTNQRGVVWSIVSGQEYAEIDSNGVVTVKAGANNSQVAIKAVSSVNSGIYATKTISVTYNVYVNYLYKSVTPTSDLTDTGVKLSNGSANATIFVDFRILTKSSNDTIVQAMDAVNPWNGFLLRLYSNSVIQIVGSAEKTVMNNANVDTDCKIAISVNGSSLKYSLDGINYIEATSVKGTTSVSTTFNNQKNGGDFLVNKLLIAEGAEFDFSNQF